MLDVGGGGHHAGEGGQVAGAADVVEEIVPFELIGDGDEVHRHVGFIEGEERRKNLAVGVLVEGRLVQQLGGVHDRLLFEQHGSQHRLLRIEVLLRQPFER